MVSFGAIIFCAAVISALSKAGRALPTLLREIPFPTGLGCCATQFVRSERVRRVFLQSCLRFLDGECRGWLLLDYRHARQGNV